MEAALIAILGASLLIALFLFSLLQGEKSQFRKYAQEQSRTLCDLQEKHDKEMQKTMAVWQQKIEQQHYNMMDEIDNYKDKYAKILSDKKKTEVRCGMIVEKIAPLLEDFPADILNDNVIPIFKTFDFLAILENEIIFIEVKSGNAQLSKRQKQIKDLIEQGKVSFKIFRR